VLNERNVTRKDAKGVPEVIVVTQVVETRYCAVVGLVCTLIEEPIVLKLREALGHIERRSTL
jgi:hypothetical protein